MGRVSGYNSGGRRGTGLTITRGNTAPLFGIIPELFEEAWVSADAAGICRGAVDRGAGGHDGVVLQI